MNIESFINNLLASLIISISTVGFVLFLDLVVLKSLASESVKNTSESLNYKTDKEE